MPKQTYPLIASLVLGLLCCCNSVAAAQPLKVMVMIEPQRFFLEQIGGKHVAVTVLVPPGADPHTYEPKPQTMVQISQARLYVSMGIPEEQAWLPRLLAIRPDLRMVRQDQNIAKLPMKSREEIYGHHDQPLVPKTQAQSPQPADNTSELPKHVQEEAHTHHHEALSVDPHIWLSPRLVRIQAETIARALTEVDAEHAADYQQGLSSFLKQIDELDQQLSSLFPPSLEHRSFLVVHPSWGYFARDYGLQQIPMEIEGREPTAADLANLIRVTTKERIRVILEEPQFPKRFAEMMASQAGIQVIEANPLAYDWVGNLRKVGSQLAEQLSRAQ